MTKLKIALSFDYELPLGGCRSYYDGLFSPSNNLLVLGNQLKVPFTLFVDINSYHFFLNYDKENYCIPFVNQLKKYLEYGHDLQLHIHPHWLESRYNNNSFIPSHKKDLHSFKFNNYPQNIDGIIEQSTYSLNSIIQIVYSNRKCLAYRAGGYLIQPSTAEIFSALKKNEIVIDSSIIKGYKYKSDIQQSDFRNLPKCTNWFIDNGNISTKGNTGIFEVPIASMNIPLWNRLIRPIDKIMNNTEYKKRIYNNTGFGMMGSKYTLHQKINNYWYDPWVLNFDNPNYTISILESILLKYLKLNESETIISAISHPKSMGKWQLSLLSQFVNLVKTKYSDRVSFVSFNDIASILKLKG